jgi:predicted DNA-binding helix-hairpin-helix protein
MGFIYSKILQSREEKKIFKNAPLFVPAGQTTQLIVGATPDNDLNILKLSESLYKRFTLKRVYYSGYAPVTQHPNLPVITKPPLLREHRLYQADWLLRFYGFKADELLDENIPFLHTELDPKSAWALRNLNLFPVEINQADYDTLLRVPGIGVRSAKRIISARRYSPIDFETLKKIGVVLKRARHFITCRGKFYGEKNFTDATLYQLLKPNSSQHKCINMSSQQLTFYALFPQAFQLEDPYSVITGEM